MISADDLKRMTEKYWLRQDDPVKKAIEFYLSPESFDGKKSLLEAELEFARQKGRIAAKPCETLVLLVGFSLEPLLQSVCVYQPRKVILLLNKAGYPGKAHEEWHVFASHVTEAIMRLVERGLLKQQPEFPDKGGKQGFPVEDSPDAVFRTLVDVLHDETDVVIDVTGGKKSMAAGAYLYAAYAGARISYVDFEEYDPEYRRPYGYSCKIGELANPYEEFALREWELVRNLYERYQFREARELLTQTVQSQMIRVLPDSKDPLDRLVAILEYYEYWDSGDFRKAKRSQAAQWMDPQKQPSAVVELGDQWFEISGSNFSQRPQRFYGDLPALQVYVRDELARIQRLIDYKEDYRSAFLRAGGVNEIVMLARVVVLVSNPKDRDDLLNALDQRTPSISSVFNALLKPQGPQSQDLTIGPQHRCDIRFQNAPSITVRYPGPMNSWWQNTRFFRDPQNGWDDFLTRRNELAHKYFSVPKEWAKDALTFVKANFNDFLKSIPTSEVRTEVRTEALPWPELCDLCGLSRFLPPNLR
jgi:hypothetical protein